MGEAKEGKDYITVIPVLKCPCQNSGYSLLDTKTHLLAFSTVTHVVKNQISNKGYL